ncbi:peroxidase 47-like [Papaver somniferum]|uniref:peroxidase 47-like n=1 Tax=Papaver somniferum TaxID=3469 RepID=UPI000E700D77|nr:peroxidase 47-like [Papaver somniferum]
MISILVFCLYLSRFSGLHGLSMNYYGTRGPMVEMMVRNTVNRALDSDPSLAAGLLRMHFHDCFVEGCDASILLNSTKDNTAETDSPSNLSLLGYEIIDAAKDLIEGHCPGIVSCADIVAMAARDAVLWAGGPLFDIPKGRKDGRRSKIEDTRNLPAPVLNSSELISIFSKHGLSIKDMVSLSGAHTLGIARCSSFKKRLKEFNSSHEVDPTLDSSFASKLSKTCNTGDDTEVPFHETRNSFDNSYFTGLRRNTGILSTDQILYTSPRTRSIVNAYAMNNTRFFSDFQQAMVKMGLMDVKEGSEGEVRQNCQRIN